MIEVEEAQARIWAAMTPGPSEWVPLAAAAGRVSAAPISARRDQPPRALSAMDGYAVRAADCPGPLEVVAEVPAGKASARAVGPGEAVRVFTGSVIPDGADAVLIQENTKRDGSRIEATEPVTEGSFVRPRGLDFRANMVGVEEGQRLDARALGLAALLGHGWLPVRRKPRVALIATGDELRWPGEALEDHQITSSNSVALAAMIASWGGEAIDLGIAGDDPASLAATLDAAHGADLLVTSGGASVGDHDLVRRVSGERGMQLDFWKIRMRPGKPLIFGDLRGTPLLGLPGNPVSALVCAIVFLRGALRKQLGLDPALPMSTARLATELPPGGERRDFLRGNRTTDGRVAPAPAQDSSMLATMARADVLIERPPGDPARDASEPVDVIDLPRILQA